MDVMESSRIADLLQPFTGGAALAPGLLEQIERYLDLLLKWNVRMNLTAVRDPDQVVARHFGESLFAARLVLSDPSVHTLADVGSGAGFPGVPMKLWAPNVHLTLIESQNKKATFLREVLRTLKVHDAEVFCGRAEQWGKSADVVTLRAVEQFERVLPSAAHLVAPGGKLCLLIGTGQVSAAQHLLQAGWTWREPAAIPNSSGRVVTIAAKSEPLRA